MHASLGQRKADVIELYQPLTRKMSEIQVAIVECMDATLAGLRKSCTGVRPAEARSACGAHPLTCLLPSSCRSSSMSSRSRTLSFEISTASSGAGSTRSGTVSGPRRSGSSKT